MASQELGEIIARAEMLPPAEQLELIARLSGRLRDQVEAPRKRFWREIRGTAPYPLAGEDAQAWITRSRQEDDEARQLPHHNAP